MITFSPARTGPAATLAALALLPLAAAAQEAETAKPAAPAPSVEAAPPAPGGVNRGTGEPDPETARLLRLMQDADTAFNARDYGASLERGHAEDVRVLRLGTPLTVGQPPRREDIDNLLTWFPDLYVHNDPYEVQFGQGEWTVAMGRLTGTFTGAMEMPDGATIEPTGKSFDTFFTTIARWEDDRIAEEFVLFSIDDIMAQITP